MSLKDKVADAKPMTEQHMEHLMAKGRASPGELKSLIMMALGAKAAKPPKAPSKKLKGEEPEPPTEVD